MKKLCLLLALTLVSFMFSGFNPVEVQAQEVFQGTSTFPVRTTETYEDARENIKFRTVSELTSCEVIYDESGLGGCFVQFFCDKGANAICITEGALISTDILRSRTDRFQVIGTGTFSSSDDGDDGISGPVYLDGKGTVRYDTAEKENITSIIFSGKIAGGYSN